MNFSRPKPRRVSEPALPMINVVFLLLIFFLMSAQIAPPPPFDVTPPQADAPEQAEADHTLYIAPDAALALGEVSGGAVWAVLSELAQSDAITLLIRADAALPANDLARVLSRASALGLSDIRLVTAPR